MAIGYAVQQAEISVLSDSMHVISALVEVFAKLGRPGVLEAIEHEAQNVTKAKMEQHRFRASSKDLHSDAIKP
jgi:predicted HAD superfamily phosphohydrolase